MDMPGEHDRPSEKESARAPERKPYHKPELVRHGTVAEVTKSGPVNEESDGQGYES
jgi:hypothetical protein